LLRITDLRRWRLGKKKEQAREGGEPKKPLLQSSSKLKKRELEK